MGSDASGNYNNILLLIILSHKTYIFPEKQSWRVTSHDDIPTSRSYSTHAYVNPPSTSTHITEEEQRRS